MENRDVFKENIVFWYHFKENSTGIVYSDDEIYQSIVSRRIKLVPEGNPVDYIILIGQTFLLEKIEKLRSSIGENTKVIVIGENDFSIEKISKYPNDKEILKNSNSKSIARWQEEMKAFGFVHSEVYYAFPNYQFVDILFHKNFAIKAEQIQKYVPLAQETQIKLLDEFELLKKIINFDQNTLDIFANSYLIEFSKKPEKQDVRFVSFNNTRKEEYRLMTVLRENVVEKIAVNDKARAHLENMKKNIGLLEKQNFNLLDYTEKGNCYSKLIKNQQTLDIILAEHDKDLDFVADKFLRLKNILLEKAIDFNEKIEESLQEYQIDCTKIKNLKFLENASIDCIPKNCFEIENQFYFFDQEWQRPFLPVDFVIYRGIINCYDLIRKIDVNRLYEKLNLVEFIEIFEKMNQKIMDDILEENLYQEIIGKTIPTIDEVLQQKELYAKQIEDFKTEDLKKDAVIKQWQEENEKKEQVLQNFVAENEKKEATIQNLQVEEKNKANYIEVLENIKSQNEQQIRKLEQINQEKDEIIKAKEHQISVYENMKSVKLVKKLKGNKQ